MERNHTLSRQRVPSCHNLGKLTTTYGVDNDLSTQYIVFNIGSLAGGTFTGQRRKREPGVKPGLPRSGVEKRPPSKALAPL